MRGGLPECFPVQTVTLFNLIECVLLETTFDVVQDVVYMMLVWTASAKYGYEGNEASQCDLPPRIELWSKVEGPILMRNKGMKHIGDEVHCWGSFRVVARKRQPKP